MIGRASLAAHLRLLILAILVFASSPDPIFARAAPEYQTRLDWKACWFQGDSDWPDMKCGVLEVPEDRTKPEGKKVRLPFVVFKAFDPVLGKLPVLVTGGGGPGNPVGIPADEREPMSESVWYNTAAMSVYDGRDLIVMDNRGVGSAAPRLACPEFEALALGELGAPLPLAESLEKWTQAYASCRADLTKAGIDINAYNTVTAAQDIEDLRLALGLPKLNIFGVSFGTRIALTYLRDFSHSVRAVVLDGVDSPEVRFYEVFPRVSHEAIKRVFDLCREDSGCRDRYGADLYARFLALLPKLAEAPITLRVTNPSNVMPIKVVLTPEVLLPTLHFAIYDEAKIGQIPRAVAALLNGSSDYVAGLVRDELVSAITLYALDDGAYASYQCFGIVPFSDLDAALSESAKYPTQAYMTEPFVRYEQAMCEAWRMIPGAPIEAQAVASQVPVLLYSGELDPITPHSAAKSAARTLPNGTLKEWPGIGHNVLSVSYCADQIAGAFFDAPEHDPLGHDCLEEEEPPTLNIRLSASASLGGTP